MQIIRTGSRYTQQAHKKTVKRSLEIAW
jgi:hypothetical protein